MRLKLYTDRKRGKLSRIIEGLYYEVSPVPAGYPFSKVDWVASHDGNYFLDTNTIELIFAYHSGSHFERVPLSIKGFRKKRFTW